MRNNECFHLCFDVHMSEEHNDAEILLYGQIVNEESRRSENEPSALEFDKAVKKMNGVKNVTVRINSPGGLLTEAIAMRGILMNAGFEKINVQIEGVCASAATLLACIPNATVSIMEGSEFMIHNPWSFCFGNAVDFERSAKKLHQEEDDVRAIYAKKCKASDEQIKQWMDDETWFSASEAVENGFADCILGEETPIVACVSKSMMSAMKSFYTKIPKTVQVNDDRYGTLSQASKEPTEYNETGEENEPMESTEMTIERLQQENPSLFQSIMVNGAEMERQRMADIDAITPIGYESLANEAKKNGVSSMDFHKQIVKDQQEKKTQFLANRQNETAPSANVAGNEPIQSNANKAEQLKAIAEEMASYAKEMRMMSDGGMY